MSWRRGGSSGQGAWGGNGLGAGVLAGARSVKGGRWA